MMSTHHHEQDSNSQLKWRKALIVHEYRFKLPYDEYTSP